MGWPAPSQTPNLEDQGLSFVRPLKLDQSRTVEPTRSKAPVGIVLGIIETQVSPKRQGDKSRLKYMYWSVCRMSCISMPSKRFCRRFRTFEALFAFLSCENWGEGESGRWRFRKAWLRVMYKTTPGNCPGWLAFFPLIMAETWSVNHLQKWELNFKRMVLFLP